MARRRRPVESEEQELNLAPIMNMVMILIPLLLLSTVFLKAGVINISSPRNAQSTVQEDEEQEEEVPVPKVVVYISEDGFRVGDQRNLPLFVANFTQPISGCAATTGADPNDMAELPPTICNMPGTESAPLVQQLDFGSLYNQLVAIRLQPEWFDEFGKENNDVISLLASPEIPFEVLVATMDVARYFLQPPSAGLEQPSGSAQAAAFQLGGGARPSVEQLADAIYLMNEEDRPVPIELFPNPVLLLPRPQQGG
jgi:biopolymer transport protein ExbD